MSFVRGVAQTVVSWAYIAVVSQTAKKEVKHEFLQLEL